MVVQSLSIKKNLWTRIFKTLQLKQRQLQKLLPKLLRLRKKLQLLKQKLQQHQQTRRQPSA